MKIRFNGIVEKRSKGCPVCGSRKQVNQFIASKMYMLPSGAVTTFRAGKVVEVKDEDGEFLLAYKYKDLNGNVQSVFEAV